MPGHNFPDGVSRPCQVDQNRRDRLARNEQAIAAPQSDAGKKDGEIAEVKKICESPGVPIRGKPHGEPNESAPSQELRYFFWGRRLGDSRGSHRILGLAAMLPNDTVEAQCRATNFWGTKSPNISEKSSVCENSLGPWETFR